MTLPFRPKPRAETRPLTLLPKSDLAKWLKSAPAAARNWVRASHFAAGPGEVCVVPGHDGTPSRALAGIVTGAGASAIWDAAAIASRLPGGSWRLDPAPPAPLATQVATGWALGAYRFERYKKDRSATAVLIWPPGVDRGAVERTASATALVRDLVNTPAEDMGPAELAAAAQAIATRLGLKLKLTVGDELLRANLPLIHAVGRASVRAPRLIDLTWGDPAHPRVAILGKGVCFDSGGLDLKAAPGMLNMKKDMGGAAHALALAQMIVEAELAVRLRVLIPAVENAVAGNAIRPRDVVRSRKGLTVEIGNTDAEGRLILADALALGCEDNPALMVDFATLTGAARVALGPELPALYCNDDRLASDLLRHGAATGDPLWRMPLWAPYRRRLDSRVADLNNVSEGSHAGSITAALFMQAFVGSGIPWAHLDIFAWNPHHRPGRPEGAEAHGLRAAFGAIAERVALAAGG